MSSSSAKNQMIDYGQDFYDAQSAGSRRSAEVIVPIVMDLLRPSKVVDIGCGSGAWLSVFKERGASKVLGLDGHWVNTDCLQIARDEFVPVDLEQPLKLQDRFDLAVCMEVAEHLAPETARPLVDSLVNLAPAVLFSAAVPFQGGTGHVNEQWPDYWVPRPLLRGRRRTDRLQRSMTCLPRRIASSTR